MILALIVLSTPDSGDIYMLTYKHICKMLAFRRLVYIKRTVYRIDEIYKSDVKR